jgi:hypothetical protein
MDSGVVVAARSPPNTLSAPRLPTKRLPTVERPAIDASTLKTAVIGAAPIEAARPIRSLRAVTRDNRLVDPPTGD